VTEELGIALEPALQTTGLIRTSMGSEFCFSCRLSISFNRLLDIKAKSRTDREIDDLLSIDDSDDAVLSFLLDHDPDMVSSGRACLLLHGREAYGIDWYGEAVKQLSQ
jgi:hypothetical protein